MTPKEKAEELVDMFTFSCRECDYEENAKQCALIAVDEILSIPYLLKYEFWFYKEVKEEIKKL